MNNLLDPSGRGVYSVDLLAERDAMHEEVRRAQMERLYADQRNTTAAAAGKHQSRRFTGETVTEFGSLA